MRSVRKRLPAPDKSPPCAFVATAIRALSGAALGGEETAGAAGGGIEETVDCFSFASTRTRKRSTSTRKRSISFRSCSSCCCGDVPGDFSTGAPGLADSLVVTVELDGLAGTGVCARSEALASRITSTASCGPPTRDRIPALIEGHNSTGNGDFRWLMKLIVIFNFKYRGREYGMSTMGTVGSLRETVELSGVRMRASLCVRTGKRPQYGENWRA